MYFVCTQDRRGTTRSMMRRRGTKKNNICFVHKSWPAGLKNTMNGQFYGLFVFDIVSTRRGAVESIVEKLLESFQTP